jgi:predicted transposase YdaD
VWTIPTGQEILKFHFESITLEDLSTGDLLDIQQAGLLPLLPLTKGGARREVVERMRADLIAAGKPELVQVGYTLASLAFRREGSQADQDWLIRSFHEMHDILRETPIYQEILKEGHEEGLQEGLEKGLEKGLEQGRREGRLQALRQLLLSVVQARFPSQKMLRQTKGQAAIIEDPAILESLILKVSMAQTPEEVEDFLLNWPSPDNQHN